MTLTVGIRCDIIFTVLARAGSSVYMHWPTVIQKVHRWITLPQTPIAVFVFSAGSLGTETACSIISAYVAVFICAF